MSESRRQLVRSIPVRLLVNKCRNRYWFESSELHRVDGGPAAEYVDGNRWWYERGKFRRSGGAAVEWPDGSSWWYERGELVRQEKWLNSE